MPRRPRPDVPAGFTLLELIVALALAALAASIVTVSLQGPYRRARAQQRVEELTAWLDRARRHARRHGGAAELTIDLRRKTLACTDDDSGEGLRDFQLGNDLRIDSVLLERREVDHGHVELPISGRGQSPSFALELTPRGAASHWLLVVGASGQTQEFSERKGVEHVLALLKTRPDAG